MAQQESYAHWLSPPYFEPRTWGHVVSPDYLAEMAVRLTKLHALLSQPLVVSDTGIVDSLGLMALFKDEGFRHFIKDFPYFLSLVARPNDEAWQEERFRIVASGFGRARGRFWTSSSGMPIQKLSQIMFEEGLKANGTLDPDWLTKQISEGPVAGLLREHGSESENLRAVLEAVRHFAGSSSAPVSAPRSGLTPSTLYTVLLELLETSDQHSEAMRHYYKTLEFIDAYLSGEERNLQSAVFTALDRAYSPRSLEYFSIRNSVIHLWNVAVQRTLSPETASVGELPFAYPANLLIQSEISESSRV